MTFPPDMPDREQELLKTIRKAYGEGLALLKQEKAYNEMEQCVKFISGDQIPPKSRTLSKMHDNKLKRIALETASSLTDVRQIWNYETYVEEFKKQGEILNKLARAWWKNGCVDRRLVSCLMFSQAGGSGYGVLVWNPKLPGGGDLELIPFDPRDVIPIDPVYSDSIQDWRGVILRQKVPAENLRNEYPSKREKIQGKKGSWIGPEEKGGLFRMVSPVWAVLGRSQEKSADGPEYVDFLRIFIKDESLNTSGKHITMGRGNWAYKVCPMGLSDPETGRPYSEEECRLYPRGRLIVCTPDVVLDDMPNPYWHGLFPVVRFTLDPLPWSLLGSSMIADLIPLQNAFNEGIRGLEDGMAQWIRRGVIADKGSIAKANLDAIDTRKDGLKIHTNPQGAEGVKIIEGPQFPEWYMDFLAFLKGEMDENSGVRGLRELAQLKQMPSEGSLEKFMDALSPLLRLRARSIEVSLGELAEMLKVGFFQYYDQPRRMQILGIDGLTLEDYNYDPGNMVPDGDGSTMERAEKHHKNFSFSIAPNSFLNVSHSTHKLMMLQLLRAQLVDPWSAWSTFDLMETGKSPAETIPERIVAARKLGLMPGPTPEMVQAQEALILMQAQMAMGQAGMMMNATPGAGAPPGPPASGSTGGRPPTAQKLPQFVQKDGGARTVVSESGT